jgi:hypothetical protein
MPGMTGLHYRLTARDAGARFAVRVTARRPACYPGVVLSDATRKVMS